MPKTCNNFCSPKNRAPRAVSTYFKSVSFAPRRYNWNAILTCSLCPTPSSSASNEGLATAFAQPTRFCSFYQRTPATHRSRIPENLATTATTTHQPRGRINPRRSQIITIGVTARTLRPPVLRLSLSRGCCWVLSSPHHITRTHKETRIVLRLRCRYRIKFACLPPASRCIRFPAFVSFRFVSFYFVDC